MTWIEALERLAGIARITVQENQRIVVLDKGRFSAILGPGEHRLNTRKLRMDVHDLGTPEFTSVLEPALFRARPDLVEAHFTEVRTGMREVAVVRRDGRIYTVLAGEARKVFWTDAGPWEVERFDVEAAPEVPIGLATRLVRMQTPLVASFEVPEGHVGLMTRDGAFERALAAGTHRFWTAGSKREVRLVDTRLRTLDVTGQEIRTADRVTVRVNLAASYRVTDPVRAAGAVKDFAEALHRALQLAFRRTLGALTLDRLLAEKVSVDAEAAERVRAEMAEIGVEVGEIALKDVILPGEMREILNRVVAAEKEAEANVIRRREETNATRSLLNTAKVMAENPVMLRLKELEALESIAARVDRLTIHNGAQGLMSDLVRLSD
ncbi:MAG: slipin family protein [Pseudomonadota bacterium]